MTVPFTPLGGRVLIVPVEPDRTTDSGLILVEDRKPDTMGRVVAVGEAPSAAILEKLRDAVSVARSLVSEPEQQAYFDQILAGAYRPADVAVGDLVLFSWTSGQEILLDEARYLIMPWDDILAVVEEEG